MVVNMQSSASTVMMGRPASTSAIRQLPELVCALGTRAFEENIIGVAKALLPHDHIGCHVFQIRPGEAPLFTSPLFARSYDGRDTVRISSGNYLRRWWRDDPDLRVFARPGTAGSSWASTLLTSDVESRGYVEACAKPSEVSERVAFTYRSGTRFVSLRLYRSRRHRPLTPSQLEDLSALSELLGSLCMKQAMLAESAQGSLLARICAQAERRGAPLSAREQQTIEGILAGKTVTDLAAAFGVAETSVVTFRQRAYMKLGISRRCDLFRAL